jgi:hypothetical protein
MVGMLGWKLAVDPRGGVADVVVAEGGSMVMDMCGLLTVYVAGDKEGERRPILLELLMSLSTAEFDIVISTGNGRKE